MKKIIALTVMTVTCISMTACLAPLESVLNQFKQEDVAVVDVEVNSNSAHERPSEIISEQPSETVSEESSATSSPAPTNLSDDIYSFQIAINGEVYQLPMWYSDFEARGWEFQEDPKVELSAGQYTYSQAWKKGDIEIDTEIYNPTINTATLDQSTVASIEIDRYSLEDSTAKVMLPGGIEVGVATKDDIIAAYGTPSSEYEGTMYWNATYDFAPYQDIELYVYYESGVLEDVEIRNMIELEGGNNEVLEGTPQEVLDYVAPTEVGTDLYNVQFELDGNVYKLPCPISEFIKNGFAFDDEDPTVVVPSGSGTSVYLTYGELRVYCWVENLSKQATTLENCFITEIESSVEDSLLDITIPCGISMNSTEAELLEALTGVNYEVEEAESASDKAKIYTIYPADGSSYDGFEICFEGGKISYIYMANDEL